MSVELNEMSYIRHQLRSFYSFLFRMPSVRGTSGKRKRSDESIPDGLESPAKRTAVILYSDGTPTVAVNGLAEKSRDRVFEAVYRELFERVHDCAAGSDGTGINDQMQEILMREIIGGAEKKFAKVCNPRHGRDTSSWKIV